MKHGDTSGNGRLHAARTTGEGANLEPNKEKNVKGAILYVTPTNTFQQERSYSAMFDQIIPAAVIVKKTFSRVHSCSNGVTTTVV